MAPKKPEEWNTVPNPKSKINNSGITVDLVHALEHTSVVCCVKFSPDGKYLATGCNHYAQIFEVVSGRRIWYFIFIQCHAR